MQKKFSFANILSTITFALVVFTVVKVQHIGERVSLIVRPSKKFAISQFENKFEHKPEWHVECPAETIQFVNMITQQPFYYLARGFQATAFMSQDGDYVIKFFHQSRLREKSFTEDPVGFLFKNNNEERTANRDEIFSSSKMCYEEFPEESGIIYVHLNRTENTIKGIKLFDSLGQSYRFQGDQTSFIVQKRAEYVLPVLKRLMKEGSVDEAKARIDQIFALMISLAEKGFVDGDIALMRNNNIGFVENRAIYIDTGHIAKQPGLNIKERMRFEFDVRLRPLYDWLKIRYPELAEYYLKRQEEIVS